jgi:hypothetical protein
VKPTFIGIGAQKCASTWLHRILASHPSVNVPAIKEANFFSDRFDHGYQWYEKLFAACDPRSQMGEVSPSYLHHPAVPARVCSYHPEIKILLTLRDPVERAMSNHRHEVRLGHIEGKDLSFEAGLANNPMYVEQGLYAKHLGNWLQYFPRQQIFIALMDDIESDPGRVARDVFQFLEIDDTFRPEAVTKRFNQSVNSRIEMLFRAKERVYQMTRAPGVSWLWSAASGFGFRNLYRRLNIAGPDAPVPSMTAATERELRGLFAADLRQLEHIVGRSLNHWGSGETLVQQKRHAAAGASRADRWVLL